VFTVRLPQDDSFGPYPIEEMAGLFLVQTGEHPGGEGTGLLFDLKGKVRHRFDHQVITGRLVGTDRVFLTSHEAVCCDASDKVLWTLAFRSPEWIASGGLVTLETGDLLAFLYGRISDSGVQVIRLNPKTGKQVWQTQCAGLGVPHSKYHHWANVRVDGDRMKVTSRASGGTFVEYLDLASGRQLKRMAPARDRDW
jgi:hypothetical protein